MKVALIAVGTELTLGQIQNGNAKTLSEKLSQIGFEVNLHLTVPDDRELMQKAFHFAATTSELIFITGGLGPTSDDFTREEISHWSGKSLVFNQHSYDYLVKVITDRKGIVREAHKQQCFFPEGAEILHNSAGTAHGFSLQISQTQLFVLPGPPLEIESIWQNGLGEKLPQLIPTGEKWKTILWMTVGARESEIAERAEPLFQKYQLKAAYRATREFVEVKLHYQEKQEAQAQRLATEMTQVLKDKLKT